MHFIKRKHEVLIFANSLQHKFLQLLNLQDTNDFSIILHTSLDTAAKHYLLGNERNSAIAKFRPHTNACCMVYILNVNMCFVLIWYMNYCIISWIFPSGQIQRNYLTVQQS